MNKEVEDIKTGSVAVEVRSERFPSASTNDSISPKKRLSSLSSLPAFLKTKLIPGTPAPADDVSTAGRSGLIKTFVLFVIIPTFFVGLYYCFLATNQFAAETRFIIRTGQQQSQQLSGVMSLVSEVTGVTSDNNQNSFAVLSYIRSSAIIDDIGGRPMMQRIFSSSGADWLSAMPFADNREEMTLYWRKMVVADLDTQSGIVTVQVRAFSAADAKWLADKISDRSEILVNQISDRMRQEWLKTSVADMDRSKSEWINAQENLRNFRNVNQTVDPEFDVKSASTILSSLTKEQVELQTRLGALDGVLDDRAPSRKVLETELKQVTIQINAQRQRLASTGQDETTVSDTIAGFERLKIEEEFASKRYSIAESSNEEAKKEVERQQLYLVRIVRATLAESSTYPKAVANIFMVFFVAFVFWAIGSLIVASVKDHSI